MKRSRNTKFWNLKKRILVGSVVVLLFLFGYYFRFDIYRIYWKRYVKRHNELIFKSFGVALPSGFRVHGIDVSYYQNEINWDLVKKMSSDGAQVDFVFVKATEGKTLKDLCFEDNWRGAKQHQILRGAYHFFRPHLEASVQFANFCKVVKLSKGDLPPVLDIEVKGGTSVATLRKRAKEWLRLAENYYGMKPIIYANINFYEKYLSTKEFESYPLWIAHYYVGEPDIDETKWMMWQHTDRACISGIEEEVDLNVFNGTKEELMGMCKK